VIKFFYHHNIFVTDKGITYINYWFSKEFSLAKTELLIFINGDIILIIIETKLLNKAVQIYHFLNQSNISIKYQDKILI
jgi:hypothetical protein